MERYGLSAVHIQPVRQIAHRVRNSSAAGRYFAIGKSEEVRRRVTRAFVAMLGGTDHVVEVEWRGGIEGPWNQARSYVLTLPDVPRRIVVLTGTGKRPEGQPSPFTQLNLARDAWGSTGAHVLVWIDSAEELGTFLTEAPDLWSHRDLLAWMFAAEDFVLPADFWERLEAESAAAIATAEREVAATVEGDEAWLAASVREAETAAKCGRPLHSFTLAQRLWERSPRARSGVRAVVGFRLEFARLLLSRMMCVPPLDLAGAPQLAAARDARKAGLRIQSDFPQKFRHAAVLANAENAAVMIENLAHTWVNIGHPSRAVASSGELSDARRIMAKCALARGDILHGLTGASVAALGQLERGRWREAYAPLAELHGALDDLGVAQPSRGNPLGDAALQAQAAARPWYYGWTRGDAEGTRDLRHLLLDLATSYAGRMVAAETIDTLANFLTDSTDLWDSDLQALEACARSIFETAKAEKDAEAEGLIRWALAKLALERGDTNAARKVVEKHVIPWCRRWKGEMREVSAWCLLSRMATPPARAVEMALKACKLADTTPSLYAQIDAREALASAHQRAGAVESAVSAWEDAIRYARTEGLRPRELATRLTMADLDDPRALGWAKQALELAEVLMRPRDEARALTRVAVLEQRGATSHGRLDRASELAEELGPPSLRKRVRVARQAMGLPPVA